MLGGEYNVTLDDTGRIVFPRRLRDVLDRTKVMLTKGADDCIWLFTMEQWKHFEETLRHNTDQFSARGRLLRQRFTKHEVDIDGHGRILIPPTLRDHAGLSKECKVLGQIDYIEIWDEDSYKAYLEAAEEDFKAGLEEMHSTIEKEKEWGNAGNSSHTGIIGRDNRISRSEGQE
jgi:MraZ protein